MKILVVDDHALIRAALYGLLEELIEHPDILEAADVSGALGIAEQHPDIELVFLDLGLPDGAGFDLLTLLDQRLRAAGIVVLSASSDREDITRALELGALGFVPKVTSAEVMRSALRLVLEGGIYVPPAILGTRAPAVDPPEPHAAQVRRRIPGLTERQLEVLTLMAEGLSNKQICRRLDLAEPTVKNHVTAILRVLKSANRTEAVVRAVALGFGGRETSD
jgi:DNA-binding NarL/FixJ family response regulator